MVPNRINVLHNRYSSTEDVQEFLSQWAFSDECETAVWVRSLGELTTGDCRELFKTMIDVDHNLARIARFDIGFMVVEEVRLEWTTYAARNSVEAAKLWLDDVTLSDEEDLILEASFRDPITGAPLYCKAIDTGRLVRKKDPASPSIYNPHSDIAKAIIAGTLEEYLIVTGDE